VLGARHLVQQLLGEDLESRLPLLLQQFPEQTEDSIRALAPYDPGNGKYITWILRILRGLNQTTLNPESGQQIRQSLVEFERVKKLSNFTGRKDINQYTDFIDLYMEMEKAKQLLSKKDQAKQYVKLADYQDYTLYRITSEQAAIKFSQNTRLCFNDPDWAKHYVTLHPPLYAVFKGTERIAALHPDAANPQYHTMDNAPIAGQTKRIVLRLAKRSGEPELLKYYEQTVEQVMKEMEAARQRRGQALRRQQMDMQRWQGTSLYLGDIESDVGAFHRVALTPYAASVMNLFSEKRKEVEIPVLALADMQGTWRCVVDLEQGLALDMDGNSLEPEMASVVGRAFRAYIRDNPRLMRFISDPTLYQREYVAALEGLGRNWVEDRVSGSVPNPAGGRWPPINRQQAEERWQRNLPRFEAYLRKNGIAVRGMFIPNEGMAAVLASIRR
jgi:hypothetical protein